MIIGEIKKGELTRLRASIRTYGGHTYLDIRIFETDARSGREMATKRGIAISPKNLLKVKMWIEQAENHFFRTGKDPL